MVRIAAVPLVVLLLAGCTAGATGIPDPTPSATTSALGADADGILAEFDIAPPASAKDLVHELEATPMDERPEGLIVSVRPDELRISDGTRETAVPLPANEFHLSVAPYLDHTHDCFFHSLTTCMGQMGGTALHVRITDDASGDVLVDKDVTTYDNGYFDEWLPADRDLTMTVDDGTHAAVAKLGTRADDPTCVTTVQLS